MATTYGVNGITYAATQPSETGANVLDDYEEGEWTPTLSGATVGTALGKYVKIGKLYQFQGRIYWTGGGGSAIVGGLPFTQPSGGSHHHGMSVVPYVDSGFIAPPSGKGYILGYLSSDSTNINWRWQPNTITATTVVAGGDLYFEGSTQTE